MTLDYEAGINVTITAHDIFKNVGLDEEGHVNLHPKNYTSNKRMRQWKFNSQNELDVWLTDANAIRLIKDSDFSATMAEFKTTDTHGCVIATGDPAFEWNGVTNDGSQQTNSLYKLTENTIDYLISQSNNK